MNLNGINTVTTAHVVKDPQEIKNYLDSLVGEVVDYRIAAYSGYGDVPQYLIVASVKTEE